jgi:hypothetical protein
VTPAEVELRFLFGSKRVSRKHVARLELIVESANIMDELDFLRDVPLEEARSQAGRERREERRQKRMEAATKFRLVLVTESRHEYVSARFHDEKQFIGLRDMLQGPPKTGLLAEHGRKPQ